MVYIDRLQNNFITTIIFLSVRMKVKITCNIIEMEKCKNHTSRGTDLINTGGNLITNPHKNSTPF